MFFKKQKPIPALSMHWIDFYFFDESIIVAFRGGTRKGPSKEEPFAWLSYSTNIDTESLSVQMWIIVISRITADSMVILQPEQPGFVYTSSIVSKSFAGMVRNPLGVIMSSTVLR